MKQKQLLTIKEAIKMLNEIHQIDPSAHGKDVYSRGTIYNMISRGDLHRYGPRHIVQLDRDEVIAKLGA